MSLPGCFVHMYEAEMTVHVFELGNGGMKKAALFFSPLGERMQVGDLASAKSILTSFLWNISPARWSAAVGSGLERWGGGYFNANRTKKKRAFQEVGLGETLTGLRLSY